MKEAVVKWPKPGIVDVDPHVDFTYIVRKDINFTINPIVERMGIGDREDFGHVLRSEYDVFSAKLVDILAKGFSPIGNVELHLYNPDELEQRTREKLVHGAISLDPLISDGVENFKLSRGYYLGGRDDFGQVERPGSNPLSQQVRDIKERVGDDSVTIIEDDIFSGGSITSCLKELAAGNIAVENIVPGIQVGKPRGLLRSNVSVDPVVLYHSETGDIVDNVDLGDPRDYLLGASGLVVKLPSGNYGRVPYSLPFVSPSARASIPEEGEKAFSEEVLRANFEFFYKVGEKLGRQVLLEHMHPDFVSYMYEVHGFNKNVSMEHVAVWAMDNIDEIWNSTKEKGELQAKLAELNLPKNIAFIDLNGTLISDDSANGEISQKDMAAISEIVGLLNDQGVMVGLCSDSPLPQLLEFSKKLNFHGPTIAENGNVISNDGKSVVMRFMKNIQNVKDIMSQHLRSLSFPQEEDCVAEEFGGTLPQGKSWAFGANRQTSLTAFGSPEAMSSVAEYLRCETDLSVDHDATYPNSVVVHEGDYRANKGKTLSQLVEFGYNVVMVGNSMSDWVPHESGVVCTFVSDARVTEDVRRHAFISDKPLVEGVVDILSRINLHE